MAANKNIKNKLSKLLWLLVAVAVLGVLIAAIKYSKETVCSAVKVNMVGEKEQMFLQENDILSMIDAKSIEKKMKIEEIDIKKMETTLEKNVWIENVELYFDKKGVLNIDVNQREPLCRLFTTNGNSFFIDANNNILPVNNLYSINVPVFTGITSSNAYSKQDSITFQCVNKLAVFLQANPLWLAQIQQIAVLPNNEFELTPTIGNHSVKMGDTSNLDSKFKRLKIFYKNVLSKVGFDKYSTINIQFKNQIVVTNSKGNAIDTTVANNSIQNFLQSSADSSLQIIDTLVKRNPPTDSVTRSTPPTTRPAQQANQNRNVINPAAPKPNTQRRTNNINNKPPVNPPKPARAVMPTRRAGGTNRTN